MAAAVVALQSFGHGIPQAENPRPTLPPRGWGTRSFYFAVNCISDILTNNVYPKPISGIPSGPPADDTTYIVDGTVMPNYMNSFFTHMISIGEVYVCDDIGPNAGCRGIRYSGTSWQRWIIPETIGKAVFGNGNKVVTITTYPGMWIDSPVSDAADAIGGVGGNSSGGQGALPYQAYVGTRAVKQLAIQTPGTIVQGTKYAAKWGVCGKDPLSNVGNYMFEGTTKGAVWGFYIESEFGGPWFGALDGGVEGFFLGATGGILASGACNAFGEYN
jgi:hypothetical protein